MNKSEVIKYELECLSTYEPKDIDHPEFEVAYEDQDGMEGFLTVCCVNLAKRALDLINKLEKEQESE